jgi:hypothetical protein
MLKPALLALALMAGSSAAAAGPLFDTYQGLCVKTAADPAAVLATADGSGWMPIPDALLQQLGAASKVEGAQGRMRSDATGVNIVMIGHKSMPVGGQTVQMRFCAVATSVTAGEPIADELQAWAGVPSMPELGGPGRAGFAFLDQGGVHTAVTKPDDEQAKALLRSGHVSLAFSQEGKGMNLLAFAVPTM